MNRKERIDQVLAALADVEVIQSAVRRLPPEHKMLLLAGMGFVRHRKEHGEDCSYHSGEACDCIPPQSVWRAPADVRRHLKERWDDRTETAARRAFPELRGDRPEPWEIN